MTPPRSWMLRSMPGSISAPSPRAIRRFSQTTKSPSAAAPAKISQITGESPNHSGAPGFGCTKPQVPERRMPRTIRPRPAAERTVPTRSSLTPFSAGVSFIRRVRSEDHEDDEHLAGEHPPPRCVGGEDAADQRTESRGDRAGRGDQAVGARAVRLAEVGRDQGDDRGHDQHRPDALEERPADDQHGQVRGQRGRERPARVDDAPDRERALAAEDLADLPTGDHQRRHHQRVERDRGLDPGDRGPDVLGDRGDRRVHHGRVQGHDELPRRQRGQDDPGCLLGGLAQDGPKSPRATASYPR